MQVQVLNTAGGYEIHRDVQAITPWPATKPDTLVLTMADGTMWHLRLSKIHRILP